MSYCDCSFWDDIKPQVCYVVLLQCITEKTFTCILLSHRTEMSFFSPRIQMFSFFIYFYLLSSDVLSNIHPLHVSRLSKHEWKHKKLAIKWAHFFWWTHSAAKYCVVQLIYKPQAKEQKPSVEKERAECICLKSGKKARQACCKHVSTPVCLSQGCTAKWLFNDSLLKTQIIIKMRNTLPRTYSILLIHWFSFPTDWNIRG